jgi:hypothetical protein
MSLYEQPKDTYSAITRDSPMNRHDGRPQAAPPAREGAMSASNEGCPKQPLVKDKDQRIGCGGDDGPHDADLADSPAKLVPAGSAPVGSVSPLNEVARVADQQGHAGSFSPALDTSVRRRSSVIRSGRGQVQMPTIEVDGIVGASRIMVGVPVGAFSDPGFPPRGVEMTRLLGT